MDPKQAWEAAQAQLAIEIAKAPYDKYVRPVRFASYDNGIFTLATDDNYCRDWLADRLTAIARKTLTGIWGQSIDVIFVVDPSILDSDDDPAVIQTDSPLDSKTPLFSVNFDVTTYHRVVRPQRAIMLPGYAFRLLSHGDLTPTEFLFWISCRQNLFEQHSKQSGFPKHNYEVPISQADIARYACFANTRVKEIIASVPVQSKSNNAPLSGLVERVLFDNKPRSDRLGQIRQERNRYQVSWFPRLSHADSEAIRKGITSQSGWSDHMNQAEKARLIQSWLIDKLQPDSLLKPGVEAFLAPENAKPHSKSVFGHTVMDIVTGLLDGKRPSPEIAILAENLHTWILEAFQLLSIPLYFLEHVAPTYGFSPGQICLILALRKRGYINLDQGTLREFAIIPGGAETLARWAGCSPQSVWRWLSDEKLSFFVQEIKLDIHDIALRKSLADQGLLAPTERLFEHWENQKTKILYIRMTEPMVTEEPPTLKSDHRYSQKRPLALSKATFGGLKSDLASSQKGPVIEFLIALSSSYQSHQESTTPAHPSGGVGRQGNNGGGSPIPQNWSLEIIRKKFDGQRNVLSKLKTLGVTPSTFMAWILSAYPKRRILDPFGYSVSRMLAEGEAQTLPAGRQWIELAEKPPIALYRLLKTNLEELTRWGSPDHALIEGYDEGITQRALRDLFGEEV